MSTPGFDSDGDIIGNFLREIENVDFQENFLLPQNLGPQGELFNPHFLNGNELIEHPGSYNFKVTVTESSNGKRVKSYVFVNELNRLYSKHEEFVALKLNVSPDVPAASSLFLFAVYEDVRYREENVVACAQHGCQNTCNNPDNRGAFFLRVSEDLGAEYLTLSQRHVLKVPLSPNPENMVVALKFACRNSCVGGINRRSIRLVSVLCNSDRIKLGVSLLDLKVVSAPIRDSGRDLAQSLGKSKRPVSDDAASSDTEEYTIRVRGEKNYLMLQIMAEGLELRRQLKKRRIQVTEQEQK